VNRYKVPQKAWKRWTPKAQEVFNKVFSTMRNKELFLHPSVRNIGLFTKEQWKTVRWNAAWVAADAASSANVRYV